MTLVAWALIGLGIVGDVYNVLMMCAVWRSERRVASAIIAIPPLIGLGGLLLLGPGLGVGIIVAIAWIGAHAWIAFGLPKMFRRA